ncbi:MAG: Glutamine--scyllo-inositol transaminase [Sphingomonadales bacterium]|nr:Glutamine--scyllo-inositol transaminase [Sphingomonadales bacterium]
MTSVTQLHTSDLRKQAVKMAGPSIIAPAPRPCWPQHDEDEIAAVTEVLRSGKVNALVHGDRCRAFEQAFASFCDVPFAIALANGTLALELALRALEIGPGDEVIIPARSFFASVSCVLAVGARPVFADIDLHSQNISAESVRSMVSTRTRAVICVHLAGRPCDMDTLLTVCREENLFLIEDCAQAHGATYRGQRVGSFGDAAAFSFCTDKIMSTGGEGGMLLLRDRPLWVRAWAYKDHGKNPDKVRDGGGSSTFRYLHDSFGSNFRMTEMQAAIGLAQLGKLPAWLAARRRNAAVLKEALSDHILIRTLDVPGHIDHAYYKYYFYLRPERMEEAYSLADVVAALNSLGIKCGPGSCPDMSAEHAFHGLAPRKDADLPNAKTVGACSIMVPVDHLLGKDDMDTTAFAIRAVASEVAKPCWTIDDRAESLEWSSYD